MKDLLFGLIGVIIGFAVGAHIADNRSLAQRAFDSCVSVENAIPADCATAVKDVYR